MDCNKRWEISVSESSNIFAKSPKIYKDSMGRFLLYDWTFIVVGYRIHKDGTKCPLVWDGNANGYYCTVIHNTKLIKNCLGRDCFKNGENVFDAVERFKKTSAYQSIEIKIF
jgi:hypothetical protein